MPTIKGFKMINGKITDETLNKMKSVGGNINNSFCLESMFGKGYKIDGVQVVTVTEKEEVAQKPVIEQIVKKTEKELYALNKNPQIEIIKGYGLKEIPNLEK
jgi:hypothetical protein